MCYLDMLPPAAGLSIVKCVRIAEYMSAKIFRCFGRGANPNDPLYFHSFFVSFLHNTGKAGPACVEVSQGFAPHVGSKKSSM